MGGSPGLRAEAESILQVPTSDVLLVEFKPDRVPPPEELISFFEALGGLYV